MHTTHQHPPLRQNLGIGTLLLHAVALAPGAPVLAAMVGSVALLRDAGPHLLKGHRMLQLYVSRALIVF